MNDMTTLMMRLIKSEFSQCFLNTSVELTEKELNILYDISKRHDITQMLVSPLEKMSALKSEYAISSKFRNALLLAVYRYKKSEYDLKSICYLFEKNGIDYIILKGGVLRKYYSSPYLRTSCDIDILIKSNDVDRATELLTNEMQFQLHAKEQYDVSFYSQAGGHFELHFQLIERGFKEVEELCNIWQSSEIRECSPHCYKMSNEYFLLYHIYHCSKHFIHGGCGIKPIIDFWIIKNKMGYDEDKISRLFKKNGLYEFYCGISALADVWFENKEHKNVTEKMEEYILQGGVYGTLEQHLAMSQNQTGGKLQHLIGRTFLSFKDMLIYYPSLKRFPLLFPFYQVRRWFRILFCGGRKRAMNEIRLNQNLSEIKKEQAKDLINELGL